MSSTIAEEQNQSETAKITNLNIDGTKFGPSIIGTVVETLPDRFELRTNNPWEEICGHTRAVRRGLFVIIAGTTASDTTKGVLHPESAYHQSVVIFERMTNALLTIGAQLTDVVRVRMFVIDIGDQDKVC